MSTGMIEVLELELRNIQDRLSHLEAGLLRGRTGDWAVFSREETIRGQPRTTTKSAGVGLGKHAPLTHQLLRVHTLQEAHAPRKRAHAGRGWLDRPKPVGRHECASTVHRKYGLRLLVY